MSLLHIATSELFIQSLEEFGFQGIPNQNDRLIPFGSKMRLMPGCEPRFDFGPSLTLAFLLVRREPCVELQE